ncbi:MAG: hypothetical protein ABL907_12380 [Hyphomicrobium sp.]
MTDKIIRLSEARALRENEIVPDMDVVKWTPRYNELHEALSMCRALTPMLAKLLPEPAFAEVREAAQRLEILVNIVVGDVASIVIGADDRAAT